MAETTGWDETKAIWANADYRVFYKVLGWIVLIGIGVVIGRAIYATPDADQAWGYGVNVFTSILSTVFTVTVINIFNRKRSEDDYKRQLVDDAASISNEIAKNAVHQIERKDWLRGEDGLLKGAKLDEANLQGAKLTGANLQNAILLNANLQKAYMGGASLQLAGLNGANLEGTCLFRAQLQRANLLAANLLNSDLRRANFRGAILRNANLQGAKLGYADFEGAILPNDDLWTPETDMKRFTDPSHPDFWQSDDANSIWKET